MQGEVDINRVRAYKWTKRGLQPNAYYATADEYQIPVQLDQVRPCLDESWLG
jgi:hypothetical protein